jgi:hypothetical protein
LISTAILIAFLWLISNTLGVQIQREAIADLDRAVSGPVPYLRLFLLAVIFHLGFEMGVYLMPFENIQIDPLSVGLGTFLVFPFWVLGISCMTWLWMSAIRFFTRRWIGSHSGPEVPRGKIRTLTLLSIVTLPVLYIPFIMTRGWPARAENMLGPALLAGVIIGILLLFFWLGGWVIVSLFSPKTKCPRCGTTQIARQAVGRECANCEATLADWLYTE